VQARQHLIERTFESLQGIPKAIVHLYNSTSTLQRKVTFRNASMEDIKNIAVNGTKLVKSLVSTIPDTHLRLQYSPESFSDTELEFALEVCEAVVEEWGATTEDPVVLNLPATVEWSTPNVHADQIEWFCNNLKDRDSVIISLHTHNDRGTGIAATELGLMAGADRVEGTLFGNGERTGNLDITTVSLNMNSHGIKTGLNFSNIKQVREVYERMCGLPVHERHPYAGDLVFTAFSGSHQDAIKKGMDLMKAEGHQGEWGVPYLTIDPKDIGRNYSKDIIRINSQSGKGGMAYILESEYGIELPIQMKQKVGNHLAGFADKKGCEITPIEVFQEFTKTFVNIEFPLKVEKADFTRKGDKNVECEATLLIDDQRHHLFGKGNGPINAMVNIISQVESKNFNVVDYKANALTGGSDSKSISYICLKNLHDESLHWGLGISHSIGKAGVLALASAWNTIKLSS